MGGHQRAATLLSETDLFDLRLVAKQIEPLLLSDSEKGSNQFPLFDSSILFTTSNMFTVGRT